MTAKKIRPLTPYEQEIAHKRRLVEIQRELIQAVMVSPVALARLRGPEK